MFANLFNPNRRTPARSTLLIAFVVTFTACKDRGNTNTLPTVGNVAQFIESNKFALLSAAINRAGLTTTLSGAGPFTLFAPTDDAFRVAGFADAAAINAAPVERIQQLIQYHVIGASLPLSAMAVGQTAQPTSLTMAASDNTIYISKTSTGAVSINGARVVQADGQATNGIIHAIDRVLTPALGNVLRLAQADTSLSLLVALAGRGGPAVVTALTGTAPLTVFAPTNAAFRSAGISDTAAINKAQVTAVTSILNNHVVPGARAYSPTLTNGATVSPVGGSSLTITVGTNNTLSVTSRGNGATASKIITPDISATNGVIHKIDRVLLP